MLQYAPLIKYYYIIKLDEAVYKPLDLNYIYSLENFSSLAYKLSETKI